MVTTEATRTNEQVRHDVQAELKWYAGIEPNEIGAAVKDGIVILGGWVDSYVKGWEAERAAVDALDWDALIPSESIKVSVSRGRVTLEGEEWLQRRQSWPGPDCEIQLRVLGPVVPLRILPPVTKRTNIFWRQA